jgi:hypothetical protein
VGPHVAGGGRVHAGYVDDELLVDRGQGPHVGVGAVFQRDARCDRFRCGGRGWRRGGGRAGGGAASENLLHPLELGTFEFAAGRLLAGEPAVHQCQQIAP